MSDRFPVVLLGAPREEADRLRAELHEVAHLAIEPNLVHAVHAVRNHGAHAALVVLTTHPEAALATIRHLRVEEPRLELIAVNDEADGALEAQAMRAGAREFVVDASGALRRVVAELAHGPRGGARGTIVTLFPTKGGVGATALATNLAGLLEAGGARTLLIDLRLTLGDVEAFLDLAAKFTIADVLRLMRTLEKDTLFASLSRHASGIDVLSQGDRVEEIDQITPYHVSRLLDFVARHYDFVIVDGVHDFDEHELTALDESDRVLLLLTQELPSVRNAQRCLRLFNRLAYPEGKVQVVLNRYTRGAGIDAPTIAGHLGVPLAAIVSNDYPSMTRAIHGGTLLDQVAPQAQVTADLRHLAAALAAAAPTRTPPPAAPAAR